MQRFPLSWDVRYLEVLALQVALDLFVRGVQVGENLAEPRLKTVKRSWAWLVGAQQMHKLAINR